MTDDLAERMVRNGIAVQRSGAGNGRAKGRGTQDLYRAQGAGNGFRSRLRFLAQEPLNPLPHAVHIVRGKRVESIRSSVRIVQQRAAGPGN